MKKDAQVVVRMPSELRDELRKLAQQEKRTLAAYINIVLEAHVARRNASRGKP